MKTRRGRVDPTSIAGIVIGVGLVLAGQLIEGGALQSVLQLTAAVIVFGGTFGAVLVSFTCDEVRFAISRLKTVFVSNEPAPERLVRTTVRLCTKARQHGIIVLENEVEGLVDPFLKKGLMLAVDGNNRRMFGSCWRSKMRRLPTVNRQRQRCMSLPVGTRQP